MVKAHLCPPLCWCSDRTAETGSISCRVCGENYQCRINYLSDPVDVFCEWIDACEAARTGTGGDASDDARAGAGLNHSDDRAPASTASARSSGGAGQTNDGWEADEED